MTVACRVAAPQVQIASYSRLCSDVARKHPPDRRAKASVGSGTDNGRRKLGDVRAHEVVALEQQGHAEAVGEDLGEHVAKVEYRRLRAAALAVAAYRAANR